MEVAAPPPHVTPRRAAAPAAGCPLEAAVEAIGGKWKIPLLGRLAEGSQRWGALRRALPGVTEKMLAQQLRQLAADGLVSRTVYPEVPPRVEYALTPTGAALVPALDALAAWSAAHLAGPWREG